MNEEQRLKRNAYMREWKRKNKEKVNAINAAAKAKRPELYREINRVSAAKKRAEDPERFRAANRRAREKDPQKFVERTRNWAHSKPGMYLFYNAKARARNKDVPFDIVYEDILPIPEFCPVLGIKLDLKPAGRRGFYDHSPSLDRIVPAKGYVKGNIRVISNRANCIKRDATPEELRKIADYIERETG